MTTPPSRRRSRHVRCRLCGVILPAWLPVPNAPESALLLHHLGRRHPDQVGSYLDRMDTVADISRVAAEAYEMALQAQTPENLRYRIWPKTNDQAAAPD